MDRPFPLQTQWLGLPRQLWRPELGRHWRNVSIAVIPAALLAVAFALAARPAPKPVEPVVRGDLFAKRFGEPLPAQVRVRTIPIVRDPVPAAPSPDSPPAMPAAVPVDVAEIAHPLPVARPPASIRHRYVQRRSGDVCSRHNMRKVMVGKYRWRCRR